MWLILLQSLFFHSAFSEMSSLNAGVFAGSRNLTGGNISGSYELSSGQELSASLYAATPFPGERVVELRPGLWLPWNNELSSTFTAFIRREPFDVAARGVSGSLEWVGVKTWSFAVDMEATRYGTSSSRNLNSTNQQNRFCLRSNQFWSDIIDTGIFVNGYHYSESEGQLRRGLQNRRNVSFGNSNWAAGFPSGSFGISGEFKKVTLSPELRLVRTIYRGAQTQASSMELNVKIPITKTMNLRPYFQAIQQAEFDTVPIQKDFIAGLDWTISFPTPESDQTVPSLHSPTSP